MSLSKKHSAINSRLPIVCSPLPSLFAAPVPSVRPAKPEAPPCQHLTHPSSAIEHTTRAGLLLVVRTRQEHERQTLARDLSRAIREYCDCKRIVHCGAVHTYQTRIHPPNLPRQRTAYIWKRESARRRRDELDQDCADGLRCFRFGEPDHGAERWC